MSALDYDTEYEEILPCYECSMMASGTSCRSCSLFRANHIPPPPSASAFAIPSFEFFWPLEDLPEPSPKKTSRWDWTEMGLAAEEKEDSLAGRVMELINLDFLDDDEGDQTFNLGKEASFLKSCVAELGDLNDPSDDRMPIASTDISSTWADYPFRAEDEEDFSLGLTRALFKHGILTEDSANARYVLGKEIPAIYAAAERDETFPESELHSQIVDQLEVRQEFADDEEWTDDDSTTVVDYETQWFEDCLATAQQAEADDMVLTGRVKIEQWLFAMDADYVLAEAVEWTRPKSEH